MCVKAPSCLALAAVKKKQGQRIYNLVVRKQISFCFLFYFASSLDSVNTEHSFLSFLALEGYPENQYQPMAKRLFLFVSFFYPLNSQAKPDR